ncbi:F0F1 ATP synthase subunit B [Ostreibacterium oceani]|uniref:ATP synthase subunit b n=1 Tax=Ostreibacterium oceani TaxID=2654998 RepID=A0A6N7EZ17_9GAMM|nr:F0F1 ATP synthase subunit B [Ostreibacterium oceani]MPV86609.1 F0F1 ATP synthase subunit B [Ostreibacterium oceani]
MNINLTLFGQLLSFGVFVWFCVKYVWPPLIKALEERKAKIAQGLTAAEEAKRQLSEAESQSDELAQEARKKAMDIVAEAESRAKAMVEAAKLDAQQAGAKQLAAAQAEISQQFEQSKQALRGQLSELVVSGVSQVIDKEIDDKQHSDLIRKLAEQL